jgi:hypothetical protein
MFAGIRGAFVHRLAEIEPIVDEFVEKALVDAFAALVGDALGLNPKPA